MQVDRINVTILVLLVMMLTCSCIKKQVDCNFVDNAPDLTIVNIYNNGTACYIEGKAIQLEAPTWLDNATYLWSPGGDTGSSITVTSPGMYALTVFSPNDTLTYEKEVAACDGFFAPNTFTPNSDGSNDEFILIGSGIGCFSLEIRDSEGTVVFTSGDIYNGWNGAFNNKGPVLPIGIYTYFVEYVYELGGEKRVLVGRVVLIT